MNESKLIYKISGEKITPNYLSEQDFPWLLELIDIYQRFAGKKVSSLNKYFKSDLPFYAPRKKLHLAQLVLTKMCLSKNKYEIHPNKIRMYLFKEKASNENRNNFDVFKIVSKKLSLSINELENLVFADLASERILSPLNEELNVAQLMLKINLLHTQEFITRAHYLKIKLLGNSRNIIRYAKWKGLICTIRRSDITDGKLNHIEIIISGPFAIFKHTLLYGRAMRELIPLLAWCNHFTLEALCYIKNRQCNLKLSSGMPIFPAGPPKKFDSKLEKRFYREFSKRTESWDIVREPEPIEIDGSLLFPDFLLTNRSCSGDNYFLEIIGFWTKEYLENKISKWKKVKINRKVILCFNLDLVIEEDLTDLKKNFNVVFFRKKIDINLILNILKGI